MKKPPRLDDVLSRLRAYRKARKISYSALASEAGLSRAALLAMDDPNWSPAADTVRAVEALIPSNWRAGRLRQPASGHVGGTSDAAQARAA